MTMKGAKVRTLEPRARANVSNSIVDRREQVGFLLRKAHQRNLAIWQSSSTDPQLTSVQAAVLTVLCDVGSCSLTELGREAAMDLATTRGVVDRLQERNLISVAADATDGRKVVVALEPGGWRLISGMKAMLEQVAEVTMSRLNPAERIALVFLLKKVAFDSDEEALASASESPRAIR